VGQETIDETRLQPGRVNAGWNPTKTDPVLAAQPGEPRRSRLSRKVANRRRLSEGTKMPVASLFS